MSILTRNQQRTYNLLCAHPIGGVDLPPVYKGCDITGE